MKNFPLSPEVENLIVAGLKSAIAGDLPRAKDAFSRAIAQSKTSGALEEARTAETIAETCASVNLTAVACDYYRQAADAARASGNKELISIFCGNAGKALLDGSEPQSAIGYFKDAAAAYEVTGDPLWQAQMLTTWGCALEDLQQFREAQKKHAEARGIIEDLPDPDRGLLSDILSNEATAFARDGRGEEALTARRRAMAEAILSGNADTLHARMEYLAFDLRKFVPGTTDADIAAEFGGVYYHTGFLQPAAEYFDQAIGTSKNESSQAELLEAVCQIRDGLGQTDQAVDAGLRGLALYQKLEDAKGEAHISGMLGDLFFNRHQLDEAERYYQNRLASAARAGDAEQRAAAFGDLGSIALLRGQYPQAIKFLQIQRTEAQDEYLKARAESGLGAAYNSLGAPSRAVPLLERTAQWLERNGRPGAAAIALNSLGIAWTRMRDLGRADVCYQDCIRLAALETRDKVTASRTIRKAWSNLAMLDLDRGDHAAARRRLEEAAEEARSSNEQRDEASALINLATVCAGERDWKASSRNAEAGLLLLGEGDLLLKSSALRTLSQCEFEHGHLDHALDYAVLAVGSDESSTAGLDDRSSRDFGPRQEPSFELAQKIMVAQGKYSEALAMLERGRGRAFKTTLEREHGPGATARAVKSEFLRGAFEVLLENQPKDLPAGAVASLLRATRKNPMDDFSLQPFEIDRIHDLGAALDSTFLVYSLIEDRVLAWVLRDREVHFKETKLTRPSALRDLASEFQKDRSVMDAEAIARQGFDYLIAPMDKLLPKDPGARLCIIPSGPLFMVPFPCLNTSAGLPLGERFSLFTAPSLDALRMMAARKAHGSAPDWSLSLVVGNPVMPVSEEWGDSELADLPFALAEAEEISQLLNASPLTGKGATSEAVLARVSQAPAIHLATHALLNDVNDDWSAIALAATDKHAGLVTARELAGLNLTSCEIVSLSACSTARGTITGDGMAGLSRAFHIAGAPRVLASLRAIPDQSTPVLMQAFYREFTRDLDAPRALREAIQVTRKAFPHPIDWAGFVLSGSP